MTPEELVKGLEDCVQRRFYFEIDEHDAKVLLEYIRELKEQVRMFGYETGPL